MKYCYQGQICKDPFINLLIKNEKEYSCFFELFNTFAQIFDLLLSLFIFKLLFLVFILVPHHLINKIKYNYYYNNNSFFYLNKLRMSISIYSINELYK